LGAVVNVLPSDEIVPSKQKYPFFDRDMIAVIISNIIDKSKT
jgi:hypothetical protein